MVWMMNKYKKWDIVWADLNPTKGNEISKTRPCVILSPNAINNTLNIVTIAPLTSTIKELPTRIAIVHNKKKGDLCIEQIRTISKERIVSVDKQPVKEEYRELITLTIFEYFK
jgi:mRNA interferase MazF